MSRRAAPLLIALAAALAATPVHAQAADEDPYAEVLERFRKAMKRPNVEKAVEAVSWLDPDEPRSLPELMGVLEVGHWMARGAAIEQIARISPGPLRSEIRLHLVSHENLWVRAGMAFAMTIDPQPGDGDALVGAMDDPEWRVRRIAARGLGEIVSREGAGRLVAALEAETDLRVLVWVRASLRAIVGKDLGRDTRFWREWWERNKDKPEWKRQGEEVRRDEFDGIPLETITIGGPPPTAGKEGRKPRERPDLFVLAPFGFSHDYYRPYLDEAGAFVRITYVTLPTVQEVTGHSGFGASIPRYPVKKLARALDKLRDQLGKDRVVVLAAGPVTWIAETFALEYPKRTAGLVLMNGWLDSQSYAQAIRRLAGQGRPAERWAAHSLMGEIETTRDVHESRRMGRIFLTHTLADRRDGEAFRIWRQATRTHGFAIVPALQFSRAVKVNTPTLFYFPDSELSPYGGGREEDLRRIRASFKKPSPVIAQMRDSRGLYHVEEPGETLRILRGFLEYAGVLDR